MPDAFASKLEEIDMTRKTIIAVASLATLGAGAAAVASTTMFTDAYTIAPPAVSTKFKADEMMSSVSVPLTVNLAALEKELNARIPDTLHTIDESRGGCFKKRVGFIKVSIGCSISGRVWKAGKFSLTTAGDSIRASMPINFEATVRGRGDIGKNIRETGRGCAEVTALIKPGISANWQPSAQVSTDFRWCERPYINVLGIQITIGSKVEPKVREALADLQPKIAEALAGADIRTEVEKAWIKLHRPLTVNADPAITAVVKPESVHFGGFRFANNMMTTSLALRASLSTMVGSHSAEASVAPLPPLQGMDGVDRGFNMAVPVRISYDEIRKLLERSDMGARLAREAGLEPQQLGVSNIEVYAAKDALAIGFDIKVDTGSWFDSRGRVYLTAKPVVDMAKRVVTFENLSFTAATDNAAVQAGVLLVGSRPVMKLTERLVEVPFGKDHAALIEKLNGEINKRIDDDLRIEGRVDTVGVNSIQFGPDHLHIGVHAKGAVQVIYGVPAAG